MLQLKVVAYAYPAIQSMEVHRTMFGRSGKKKCDMPMDSCPIFLEFKDNVVG